MNDDPYIVIQATTFGELERRVRHEMLTNKRYPQGGVAIAQARSLGQCDLFCQAMVLEDPESHT